MSLPSLPENNNITRDDAINLIFSSIAAEEIGLSHIINTEGEELQYTPGMLDGAIGSAEPLKTEDLLKLNRSVRKTLGLTMQNQFFLNAKMPI